MREDINLKMKGKRMEFFTDRNGIIRFRGSCVAVPRFAVNSLAALTGIAVTLIIAFMVFVAAVGPVHAQQQQNDWGRCINPDFDSL